MVVMTKLGQNFLVNKNVAQKIVGHFRPQDGPILEIGPGQGMLTLLLVEQWPDNSILAVELDENLAQSLAKKNLANLQIITQNILTVQLDRLEGNRKFNIIGNIPYYISKEMVDWLVNQHHSIQRVVLMVQKEFADKLLLKTGIIKPQSLIVNLLFDLKKLFDVNPGSFSPPPKVKSTVMELEKRNQLPIADVQAFYSFLKRCFHKRRKTLLNNLISSLSAERIETALAECQIPARTRPDQLDLDTYILLYQKLGLC